MKMRNGEQKKKSAQGFYVSMLVILLMAAVIVAVAGAVAKNASKPANDTDKTIETSVGKADAPEKDGKTDDSSGTKDALKHKKDLDMRGLLIEDIPDPEDKSVEDDDGTKDKNDETGDASDDTGEKTDVLAEPVEKPLPVFNPPVNGEILKSCSLKVPVFSLTMEDYRTHPGIDIYASDGTSVAAAADGTVTEIGKEPMMGMTVKVAHDGGAVTIYKNLSADLPEDMAVGKTVKAGDIIGCVGDTALAEIAEESHLHFEMVVNGSPVDPSEYITLAKSVSYSE